MNKPIRSISLRFYGLLLSVYPYEFRREFSGQMLQLFRDCQRAGSMHQSQVRFWCHILTDLVGSAAREHYDSLGKEHSLMNTLRRELLGLLGCAVIIVLALWLLRYGIANQVSSILFFGRALDAVVTAGVLGNLLVFLLVKFSKFNPLRVALWTFLIVNAVPALILAIIGSRIDPGFNLTATFVGYLVSFLFWFGLHWAWRSATPRAVSES
jgi:hypothetical protein